MCPVPKSCTNDDTMIITIMYYFDIRHFVFKIYHYERKHEGKKTKHDLFSEWRQS